MALSGSTSTTFNNGAHTLRLEWSAKQNIAGNYSDVTATLYLKGNYSYSTILSGGVTKRCGININGDAGPVHQAAINIVGTENRMIFSRTVRVHHNADGTKSHTITGYLIPEITWSGVWTPQQNVGLSVYLNTIPRATTPTVSASSVEMGKGVTINMPRASSSFTHKVYYDFAGYRKTLSTNAGTSLGFTPAISEFAPKIPSATKNGGTITCETFNGSTKIGSKTVNLSLTVPASVVPTLNTITTTENNPNVTSKLGSLDGFVQGNSKIRFNVGNTIAYGSAITEFKFEIGGKTFTNGGYLWDLDLNNQNVGSGSLTCKITIKDKRGRTASKNVSVKIFSYSPPKISSLSAQRVDNSDTVKVVRNCSYSSILQGTTERNPINVKTEYKINKDSTWTVGKSEINTTPNNEFTLSSFDVSMSYDVRVTISDQLNSNQLIINVSTAFTIIDLHRDEGIGIGKIHEQGVLDVGGNSYMNGFSFMNGGFGFCGVLPNGDTTQVAYWHKKFPEGMSIWYTDGKDSVIGKPQVHGNVIVLQRNNDYTVMFFHQPSGYVYRLGGNESNISGWQHVDQAGVAQSPLWEGGWFLNSSQSLVASKAITDCKTGYILEWVGYNNNASTGGDICYTYLPKTMIIKNGLNKWHRCVISGHGGDVFAKVIKFTAFNNIRGDNQNGASPRNKSILHRVWEY